MYFPMLMPMIIPVDSASMKDRVQKLEAALLLSLETISLLVNRLEAKFGPEFLGEELKQLTAGSSETELHTTLDAIEHSLASGETPSAARQIRESFHLTWDQAHELTGTWKTFSRQQKLRWLRLAKYIHSLGIRTE